MGKNCLQKVLVKIALAITLTVVACINLPARAQADQYYASSERSEAARGHYARSRALLVEALAEFEQGRRLARPDMLLDAEEWRISLVSRTEELNRVLDPQPRVTRSGTRFMARGLRARRAEQQLPVVEDGAKLSNTYAEELRKLELEAATKAEKEDVAPPAVTAEMFDTEMTVDTTAAASNEKTAAVGDLIDADSSDGSGDLSASEEVAAEETAGEEILGEEIAVVEPAEEAAGETAGDSVDSKEDEEISAAIEEAIQERLNKLDKGGVGAMAQFDDGEVLPGLNESWTFMGGNAMEWACGLVVFLLISLFADSPARAMPFMLSGWVLTTVTLASMRRSFPDEERGVRNAVGTACGFPPPGIPLPAALQPVWSHAPLRAVPAKSDFCRLGLERIFPSFQREYEPDDLEELLKGVG